MKILIWFFFLFLLMDQGLAQEPLQGRIAYDGPGGPLKVFPGSAFKAVLEIWPLSGIGKIGPREIEGKIILNLFYVSRVFSVEISPHNQDVLSIKALLVLTRSFKDTSLHLLEIGGKRVPVFISQIEPARDETKVFSSFLYALDEAEEDKGKLTHWGIKKIGILGGGILLLLLAFPRGLGFLSKRKKKKKIRELYLFWEKKFLIAKSREDFEGIYQGRKEWRGLPAFHSPVVEEFFQCLGTQLFKGQWTGEDLQYVRIKLQKIWEINGI